MIPVFEPEVGEEEISGVVARRCGAAKFRVLSVNRFRDSKKRLPRIAAANTGSQFAMARSRCISRSQFSILHRARKSWSALPPTSRLHSLRITTISFRFQSIPNRKPGIWISI